MGATNNMTVDRRALVIDDNPANRREICDVLAHKGYEVSACDSLGEGKKFFRSQPLVLAGCHSENGDVQQFIDQLRNDAGMNQPYIITLETKGSGNGLPGSGVNDVLFTPVDGSSLELKLDAAQSWLAGREIGNRDEAKASSSESVAPGKSFREPDVPLFDEGTLDLARELIDSSVAAEDAAPLTNPPKSEKKGKKSKKQKPQASEETVSVRRGSGTARARSGSGRVALSEGPNAATRYHLQLMVESCPLGMAMFDRSMNYLFANGAWRRAFDLAEVDLTGRGHFEIFSEVSETWRLLCERCQSEGAEQTGEEMVEWADGARDWVRWIMRPWFFEDGVVGGVVVSSQSITGEKRLRREQRFESDVAEAVMASSTNPVLVLDANGRIIRSNRAAKKLGRWDPAGEERPYYWDAYLRKGKRRESQEQFLDFARQLHDHSEFSFAETSIEEVVGNDKRSRRVVWSNSPQRDEDGVVCGMVRVGFDLDRFDDPQRDEALRETLMDALPVPAWRCDASGKIDRFNVAWTQLRGAKAADELDNGWMDGLRESDIDPIIDALRAAAVERKSFSQVVRLAAGDGQPRWMRFSAEPSGEVVENGSGASVYGVAVDVSGEHELNAALGEAHRMRQSSDEATAQASRFEGELATTMVELKRLKSERSEASDELQRYRVIPDSAPFGIMLLARDGKTVYSNKALAKVSGSKLATDSSLEEWLKDRCAEEGENAGEELVENWRARVWRKGATGVYSLLTDEGAVRELEFRPKLMDDGGLLVTVFDVTDARRGEQALRSSEAKFRALFRDSGIGMALVDRRGEVFDSNLALESMLGRSGNELRGVRVEELLAGDGATDLIDLLARMADEGRRAGEISIELATIDGAPISAKMHVSQVRASDGRLLFSTYFFQDVSDELMALQGLEDSMAENRALFGASPDLIAVVDDEGRMVDVIPPVDFPLKVDREGALGRELEEVLPEIGMDFKDIASATDAADRGKANERVFTRNFSVDRDKGNLHFEMRASRSGGGNMVLLLKDVSDAQQAQNKLQWQALTFAHIHDAIVVSDMRGRVIDWNPAAEDLFGHSKKDAIGKGLHEFYGADDPHGFRDEFTTAIRNDHRWSDEREIVSANGDSLRCEVVFVPLQDENGTALALVGVNHQLVEAAAAPSVAVGVDDARAEMQSRLNATLRTVSTLLGLQAHGAGEDTARAGKARVDALALLHSHVGEDQDYANVDFGKYAHDLINELLETEAPDETDVEVHLNVKDVVLPATLAMPVALVANELVANAFRHGCVGRNQVTVGFGIELDREEHRGALVVKNDGAALPPGFAVDRGTGLGLRIARGLAERIGGTVELVPGSDIEFRVEFKLP